DIDERILEVARLADIVKCPVVDGKEFPEVDVALVEGAITSDEHFEEILHIRRHSKVLIALGDCAIHNNVSGLRNFFNLQDVMDTAYKYAPGLDPESVAPNDPLLLKLNDKVVPLSEVVHVDHFINGCPPDADTIFYVLFEYLNDRVPAIGANKRIQYG
ncbi:MAG TPA: hypothetical protein VK907_13850, partial [Phnomibacter sp.]|nr:hypothetical protein [Phnomibacter sp.]